MYSSRQPGLRNLTPQQRRQKIEETTGISSDVFETLALSAPLSADAADLMIENVVGVLGVPVGIATNFIVDDEELFVPMATEEPSVVAAASNAAKLARTTGGFHTSSTGPVMRAQVQILGLTSPRAAVQRIAEHKDELIDAANAVDPMLASLGGGCLDIESHVVETEVGTHVVAHLIVDVRDAMGANAVNSMAEKLAPRFESITGGTVLMRILSNKADLRLARARVTLSAEALGGADVVDNMVAAGALAVADPYRAATHNKGIMNGISAVVLATGNDTRAVEAGCHSHAVRNGMYSSLSHFERRDDGDLDVSMELPMAVGLVGGATRTNPTARAAIKLMNVSSADKLARIITAVGLAQNIAAVRVLATEGVQRGHMTLHARQVAVSAGATASEVPAVVERLIAHGTIRSDAADSILRDMRGECS